MNEKLIELLRKEEGYVSGEEISRVFNISRASIWKYIQELRESGYEIVAVPHLGYQLISSPDKLLPVEIHHGLLTKAFGQKIIYHDTLPSTMDEAFRLGISGAVEGTLVVAEGQTKGRGRLGRSWVSPKGKGIYASIILRPKFSPSEVAKITLLAGVAVCEAIKKTCAVSSLIKWPNDLLIEGKKVAGILTELNAETDRVNFVAVGFGVNVNSKSDGLPSTATSLRSILNQPVSRIKLLQNILLEMEENYREFQKYGFARIAKKWRESSATLGKRVKIIDPSEAVEGIAVDIDIDGGLLIRKDSGVVVKKISGDVIQAR